MEGEHTYTTLRMPVDTEQAKHAKYTEAYTPKIDKSMWRRVNYQVTWFTKGIMSWYYQKLRHFLNKNIPGPREMIIQADICIKDNTDEVNTILSLPGVSIIPTKPEYIRGFNNGNKNSS